MFTGDETMKAPLKFRPDLRACELEDRLVPVTSNPGVIVLTTEGYILMSTFPGAMSYITNAPGGPSIPTTFFMTGSGGISSIQPGNITGIPGLAGAGTKGSSGGAAVTITVGSGANEAVAPIITLVTRNTIANDALNAAPSIGRMSGDRSDVLPPGRVYRDSMPVTAPGGVSTEVPSQRAGHDPDQGDIDPLPIRSQSRPHRLASGASKDPVKLHTDREP
jgi:hypothetical protein